MADSNKRANQVNGADGSNKRPCYSHVSTQPKADVTIVVGDKEFHEDSHFLCYISDYFRAALNSGMKESQTKRFSFPDKDPKDWELFISIMRPLSNQQKTSKEEIEKVLPFCTQLFVKEEFLSRLDSMYQEIIFAMFVPAGLDGIDRSKATPSKQKMSQIMQCLEIAGQHRLLKTRKAILSVLKTCLKTCSAYEIFETEHLDKILSLIRENDEWRTTLTTGILKIVPVELQTQSMKAMLKGSLLQKYIAIERRTRREKQREKEAYKSLRNVLLDLPGQLYRALPHGKITDGECRDMLQTIVDQIVLDW